jgi:hypothetical protein
MEVGNGLATGQGSNPQIGLEVSRDNGKTWGAQMWRTWARSAPTQAHRMAPARHGFQFRFQADRDRPGELHLVSACVNPED